MLSGIKSRLQHLRISTKLTLVQVAILAVILFITHTITTVGLYFTVYHQAWSELEQTIENTLLAIELADPEKMPKMGPPLPEVRQGRHRGHSMSHHNSVMDRLPMQGTGQVADTPANKRARFIRSIRDEGSIIPGVVLRVVNEDGVLVYDGAQNFPSLEDVRSNIVKKKPFWLIGNATREISAFDNYYLYYDVRKVVWNGTGYELHFLRAITAERQFLENLQYIVLGACLIGIGIAVFAGMAVSKRTLRPIATIIRAAREMEVGDLSKRIPASEVHDELSELIDTFNHMLERLEQGFEHERAFVSDASHELRTPVTVIRGYVDMLKSWGASDPATLRECVEAISSEAENMQHLLENLLFLARADLRRQVVKLVPVDLEELLTEISRKARLVAGKHEVILRENAPAIVEADEFMLKELLRVFLENAVKYTPEGGRIELGSARRGDRVTVFVADNGIGIDKADQARVFDRFFRVDKARCHTSGEGGKSGTGLGLSIAREISRIHGFELVLESELGKGTRISFTMACLDTEEAVRAMEEG